MFRKRKTAILTFSAARRANFTYVKFLRNPRKLLSTVPTGSRTSLSVLTTHGCSFQSVGITWGTAVREGQCLWKFLPTHPPQDPNPRPILLQNARDDLASSFHLSFHQASFRTLLVIFIIFWFFTRSSSAVLLIKELVMDWNNFQVWQNEIHHTPCQRLLHATSMARISNVVTVLYFKCQTTRMENGWIAPSILNLEIWWRRAVIPTSRLTLNYW